MDKNETPEEALRREVKEETGLIDYELIMANTPRKIDERAEILPQAHFLLLEKTSSNHFHLDFIFFGVLKNEVKVSSPENLKFCWLNLEEILADETIFANVKEMAKEGFKIARNYCQINN